MKRYILLVILVLVGCEKIEFDDEILFKFREASYEELSFNKSNTKAYLVSSCIFCGNGGVRIDSIIFELEEDGNPSKIVDRRLWIEGFMTDGNLRIKDAVIKHWDPDSIIIGTFKFKSTRRLRDDWNDFPFIWEKPS